MGSKKLLAMSVAFICVMVCASVVLSSLSLYGQARNEKLIKQSYGEVDDINREDNVNITGKYTILSTLQISDAYKSGDTSKLSDVDKETADMAKEVIENVIKEGMTDYDKEKAIYDFLVKDLVSTTGILTVIPETESENDTPHDVLKNKTAVCVGYATTFRMFMQMLDIECKVIHSKDLVHSWNLVKLDGEWYHVDCYSDDKNSMYCNFNMNDEQAAINHNWTRAFFPQAEGIKYNYILSQCEEIKSIYDIPKWVLTSIKDKKTIFSCTFKEKITEDNQYAAKLMTDSLDERLIESNDYNTTHRWIKNSNDEYVLCYTIDYYNENNTVDEKTETKIKEAIQNAMEKYFYNENRMG